MSKYNVNCNDQGILGLDNGSFCPTTDISLKKLNGASELRN